MTIRRIDSSTSDVATSEPSFCVGGLKLLAMSLATFGLYLIYWLYRNWKAEQARSGDNIAPLARAVFAVLFFHSLAARVALRSEAEGLPPRFSPVLLTTVFVVLALSPRLPESVVAALAGHSGAVAADPACASSPRRCERDRFASEPAVWRR
jgi:hypothetical protein